jgi:hypothetical protein
MAKIKKAQAGVTKERRVDRSPDGMFKMVTKTKTGPGINSRSVKEKRTLKNIIMGGPKSSGVMSRPPMMTPPPKVAPLIDDEERPKPNIARGGTKIKKAKSGAWQRKEGKNPSGGLNAKGRASYNRETGGHLKAPQPQGGPRKRSFCARMKGMKRVNTSSKTANDPNSRINKSLRKWKC